MGFSHISKNQYQYCQSQAKNYAVFSQEPSTLVVAFSLGTSLRGHLLKAKMEIAEAKERNSASDQRKEGLYVESEATRGRLCLCL
jgi:hypothetical protein